jgi:tetratricopeptide (TPR) repeat protein
VEPIPVKVEKPAPKKPVKKAEPKKPLPEMPPPVRGDQIVIPDDSVLFPKLAREGEESTPQNDLIREGQSYLAQGKWEDAIDSLQKAADENPSGESALDALHLSARIAQDSLRDPKRASEIYRKEAEMARQMIQSLVAKNDTPPENVKMRLARALTSTGLLERDPKMIQQAADEVQPEAGSAATGE